MDSTTTSRPVPGHNAIAAQASSWTSGESRPGRDPGAPHERRSLAVLRYLDVGLVLIATVPALALGVPTLGYLVAAAAWVLQRVLAQLDRRWIRAAVEPRTQLALNLFEAFGRIWLLAGAIVLAGVVGGRADGLAAAVTVFGAYTVAFAIKVLTGPPKRKAAR